MNANTNKFSQKRYKILGFINLKGSTNPQSHRIADRGQLLPVQNPENHQTDIRGLEADNIDLRNLAKFPQTDMTETVSIPTLGR